MKGVHLTEDEVQDRIYGLLSREDSARAAEHLAGCAECRALEASFEALGEGLARLPCVEPPPDFTAGVMARIGEREKALSRERRLAAVLLAALAAALGAGAALAGPSAFAAAVSEASASLAGALRVARLSGAVLTPVLDTLRLEIGFACAALGLPLFLGLSRLLPARHRPTA